MQRFIKISFATISLSPIIYVPIIAIWNKMEYQETYFITNYSVIRETFGLTRICIAFGIFLTWVRSCTDRIPMKFYYHVSMVLESLVEEWDTGLKNEGYLQVIW